jgi:hypothetical protein
VGVSPEVAGLVSAADLDVLERSAAAGYQCAECGQPGQLGDEPATLVVRMSWPQVADARIAHGRCSPSRVIWTGQDYQVPPEMTMTVVAAVVPHAAGYRALVVAEPPVSISTASAAGDRVDLLTAGLMERGLSLVTAAGQRPAAAAGWAVTLPSAAEALITGPGGELFYGGELVQPPPWQQLVAAAGAVELLAGAIGLAAIGPGDLGAALRAIGDAARAGHLVGGTVAVR